MADSNLKQDSSLANIFSTLVRCLTLWNVILSPLTELWHWLLIALNKQIK
jgi:hypothetical protein